MRNHMLSRLLLSCLMSAFVLSAHPVFSQAKGRVSRPLVILTPLTSPPGDTVAETLASTMTSSIDLMLKLAGTVDLERADFLSPTTALAQTILYYRERKADEAVYGTVKPSADGAYRVELDIWSSSKPRGRPTVVRRTMTNLLSSFDVADHLSLTVASTVVGRKLSEGTLLVHNVSDLSDFSVYANGHLLGRNRTSFRILTGNWKIVVAKPGEIGDVPVQTFHVQIKKDTNTRIALTETKPSSAAAESTNKPLRNRAASPRTALNGNVTVTSKEAGIVFLDHRKVGEISAGGSLHFPSLSNGFYEIEIVYDNGMTETKTLAVMSNTPYTLGFHAPTFAPSPIRQVAGARPNKYLFESVTYTSGPQLLARLDRYQGVPASMEREITGAITAYKKARQLIRPGLWTLLGGAVVSVAGVLLNAGVSGNPSLSGIGVPVSVVGIGVGTLGLGYVVVGVVRWSIANNRVMPRVVSQWNAAAH